jgi:hypothetical protein
VQQSDLFQESATLWWIRGATKKEWSCVEEDDGVVVLLVSVWAGRGEEVWSSEMSLLATIQNCCELRARSWAGKLSPGKLSQNLWTNISQKAEARVCTKNLMEDQGTHSWFWPDQSYILESKLQSLAIRKLAWVNYERPTSYTWVYN